MIDVIEDHTGRALTPGEFHFYEKLSSDELAAIGDEIEDAFTQSDYQGIPRLEGHERAFAFSAFSRTSQVKSWNEERREVPLVRRGELYFALTYLPAIAVPIDLERIAKRSRWHVELSAAADDLGIADLPTYEARFLEELRFFAQIRELIHENVVILIPERFALEGDFLVGTTLDPELITSVARSQHFHDQMIMPNGRWYESREFAAGAAVREVIDLLNFCSDNGYEPAIDDPVYEITFQPYALTRLQRRAGSPKRIR